MRAATDVKFYLVRGKKKSIASYIGVLLVGDDVMKHTSCSKSQYLLDSDECLRCERRDDKIVYNYVDSFSRTF